MAELDSWLDKQYGAGAYLTSSKIDWDDCCLVTPNSRSQYSVMNSVLSGDAVISHEKVSDAASIAIPDEITGEAIVVFFVTDKRVENTEISDFIAEKIGKIARPKLVFQLSDLPKTRTGKIMRRLLKSKLLGEDLGDISSLENPSVLDEVRKFS